MRRTPSVAVLLVILAATLAGTLAGCGRLTRSQAVPPGRAVVDRVVDGDTVVLRLGEAEEPVRLIGIDTPETVKPDTPVQCFGPEASKHLKTLLPEGTAVSVARDREARDHFGRLLLYLWRSADRRFVNLDLVAGGYARPLSLAPNVTYRGDFAAAAAEARAAGLGLWSACAGDTREPP